MDASIRLTAQGRGDNISYPRYQRQMERSGGTASMLKDSPLPSPSAIESKINEALKDAVKDMNALGVYTLDKNWFVFDKSLAISLSADKNDGVNDRVVDECEEEIDSDAANTEEIDEDAVDRHDMDVLRSIHDCRLSSVLKLVRYKKKLSLMGGRLIILLSYKFQTLKAI